MSGDVVFSACELNLFQVEAYHIKRTKKSVFSLLSRIEDYWAAPVPWFLERLDYGDLSQRVEKRQDAFPADRYIEGGAVGFFRKNLFYSINVKLFQYVFSGFLFFIWSANGCAASFFEARVSRIIDGDSIVVCRKNEMIEIRLYGIDAPEWRQPFSRKARSCLAKAVFKKNVIVYPQYYDSYGRLVAHIEQNGRNINGYLVEQGWAWVYPHFCKQSICDGWYIQQKRARQEHKGLWRGKKPVSPWIWKRNRHKYK